MIATGPPTGAASPSNWVEKVFNFRHSKTTTNLGNGTPWENKRFAAAVRNEHGIKGVAGANQSAASNIGPGGEIRDTVDYATNNKDNFKYPFKPTFPIFLAPGESIQAYFGYKGKTNASLLDAEYAMQQYFKDNSWCLDGGNFGLDRYVTQMDSAYRGDGTSLGDSLGTTPQPDNALHIIEQLTDLGRPAPLAEEALFTFETTPNDIPFGDITSNFTAITAGFDTGGLGGVPLYHDLVTNNESMEVSGPLTVISVEAFVDDEGANNKTTYFDLELQKANGDIMELKTKFPLKTYVKYNTVGDVHGPDSLRTEEFTSLTFGDSVELETNDTLRLTEWGTSAGQPVTTRQNITVRVLGYYTPPSAEI